MAKECVEMRGPEIFNMINKYLRIFLLFDGDEGNIINEVLFKFIFIFKGFLSGYLIRALRIIVIRENFNSTSIFFLLFNALNIYY